MMAAVTLCLGFVFTATAAPASEWVFQSEREIPVARRAEVVVVGGSLSAVAAATQAAESGRSVLLVAPCTYIGDDLAGTLRLWLDEGTQGVGELTGRVFQGQHTTTPLRVKRTLEAALLEAEVDFLLASFATDVLRDDQDRMAGVVIANRAGRQAVLSKVVIDATEMGTVARMAGAEMRRVGSDKQLCSRVVLGGRSANGIPAARKVPAGIELQGRQLFYHVYEKRLRVGGESFVTWAEAEQRMRDETYRPGQLRASHQIQVVPGFSIRGRVGADHGSRRSSPDIGHFLPKGVDGLYVMGGAADVPRSDIGSFMRPDRQEQVGKTVGHAAARHAAERNWPNEAHVSSKTEVDSRPGGDIRETLTGLRAIPAHEETVTAPATALPLWENVDVVIVGGGTSGASAAIGAARRGAKVLVVEYQEGLGGVGTVGLIGKPYHGLDRGFTAEVPFPDKEHNTEHKMEWFRRRIRDEGGKIWLGTLGCGVYVENGRTRGAVVATPVGRGVVLADVVIDATGNADMAVAGGADSMYGGDSTGIALQGTGLPQRPLTDTYVNTDYLLVDESDMVDTWRAFVGARLSGESDAYDMGPFIQTRERRRVVGDHILSYLSQIAGRAYPDSIVLSGSNYDSHGYPSEPYFALIPHTEKTLKANHPAPGGTCYTPYRCLLPRGVEGMLVTGLGISMFRDASAMVRMQKDMHNQGYAAGVAAAMAVRENCTPREIDVRGLQRHLVEIGNLPESVLSEGDSFPLPEAEIGRAVARFTDAKVSREKRCKALAIILSHGEVARPLLRQAYSAETGDGRLAYAKVLAFLGEEDVSRDLLQALEKVDGWDAKILQGRMAEYAHLPTPVDALILGLGYSGSRAAIPEIIEWLRRLDADVTLSHHRAVALALEKLASPAAAEPLARLLEKPGMRGHVMTELEPLYNRKRERRRRVGPLREIILARALHRCGDHQGKGEKILNEYRHDIRGLFARHAEAVLSAK
ncbi:MAG: FAD-dependent oxidoreductase [Planctomycetota bacterium]